MVVASIALLVALGGTSVAAVSKLAPANSVGTNQVVDGSLLAKDLKAGVIPSQGALAYAHINRDGTLDAANSKNVALVPSQATPLAKPGTYCLDVTTRQAPRNAVATIAETAVPGASAAGEILVELRSARADSTCGGDADAIVTTNIVNGNFVPRSFYIVFN
jgi:hypothetical protein